MNRQNPVRKGVRKRPAARWKAETVPEKHTECSGRNDWKESIKGALQTNGIRREVTRFCLETALLFFIFGQEYTENTEKLPLRGRIRDESSV